MPEKNSGLQRIRIHGLYFSAAAFYQLSYQDPYIGSRLILTCERNETRNKDNVNFRHNLELPQLIAITTVLAISSFRFILTLFMQFNFHFYLESSRVACEQASRPKRACLHPQFQPQCRVNLFRGYSYLRSFGLTSVWYQLFIWSLIQIR